MYINIGGVTNPAQTQPTSTFIVTLLDSSNQAIETVDNGVYFTATSGGFSSLSLAVDSPYINTQDVGYIFTLVGEDSFTN